MKAIIIGLTIFITLVFLLWNTLGKSGKGKDLTYFLCLVLAGLAVLVSFFPSTPDLHPQLYSYLTWFAGGFILFREILIGLPLKKSYDTLYTFIGFALAGLGTLNYYYLWP